MGNCANHNIFVGGGDVTCALPYMHTITYGLTTLPFSCFSYSFAPTPPHIDQRFAQIPRLKNSLKSSCMSAANKYYNTTHCFLFKYRMFVKSNAIDKVFIIHAKIKLFPSKSLQQKIPRIKI